MVSHYGWLMVHGDVDHPLAWKRGGHIYVSKQDVADNKVLVAGDIVTFYLYADDQGLGAESCRLQQRAATNFKAGVAPRNEDPWHRESSWAKSNWEDSHPFQSQRQFQPWADARCFVPMGFAVTGAPYASMAASPGASANEDFPATSKNRPALEGVANDGKLPSVGSTGHSDGSCKRCAFFAKGRCQNGVDCSHCHFDHTERLHQRKRRQPRMRSQHQGTHQQWFPEVAPIKDQPPQIDDALSQDDNETTAPSLSSVSDDDCSTSGSAGTCTEVGLTPLPLHSTSYEASESESATLPASAKQSQLDEEQTKSPQECPRPGAHWQHKSLTPSPTSWSAQQRMRKAALASGRIEVSTADTARMARALLNKLTQDRFESLVCQILALPLSTPEQLVAVAAEIFEKATTQECFRSMYVELCVRLDMHLAEQSGSIGGKAFRKALASECQSIFERNLQPADAALFDGLTGEERFEVEMKLKTRRLGNMRFIGDLLVRRLLAQKLMPPIVNELLHGGEAALESLVALLTVVAPVFEQKSSPYQAPMRDVFARLRCRKADQELSTRVRFQLTDLFDSQARGWAPRSR